MANRTENKIFSLPFPGNERWTLSDINGAQALAQLKFWNDYQSYVLPLLQNELNSGWVPISEVGPGGMIVELKREGPKVWSGFQWLLIGLSGCFTFGLGWILSYFIVQYDVYYLREFRVLLQRSW